MLSSRGARIVGVVDFGDVGVRHPLVDTAWWLLIVRHHHRAEFDELLPTLLEAGGLMVRDEVISQMAAVALLRACELATGGASNVDMMLPLVHTAIAWTRDAQPGS